MLSKLRNLLTPNKPKGDVPPTPVATESEAAAATPSGPTTLAPSHAVSWDELFQQAQGIHKQGHLDRAIELYTQCLEQAPDQAEPHYKRANALNGLGRLEPALADYDRAVSLNPSHAYALCNRGSVLERLGRREEAIASFDRALELDPKDALTHYNRGSALKDLQRYTEALTSYATAIALNADFAEAHMNRGSVFQELLQHEAAIESFGRAIALNPAIVQAFRGRASSLHLLKRWEPALADYSKALSLQPDLADMHLGRAKLLVQLGRHAEAVSDFLKATELKPDAETYQALAESLQQLKRFDLASAALDKAAALNPNARYLAGSSRQTRMHLCSWDGLDADLERIANGIGERKPVCHPMTLAALVDSAALVHGAAEIWTADEVDGPCTEDRGRIAQLSPAKPSRPRSDKIRIGYFSSDLRTHPVAYLTAGLFESHDRTKFEVTAFAFGPVTRDPMALRLAKAFDRCIDVRQKSDLDVASMARDLDIDIAVDMNGFSAHNRTGIFGLRAAPVQINFLGYPATMGAGFMDYIVADGMVVPRELQKHYTEKIAYLPGSFLPFDSSYTIAARVFSRAELGLPSAGFVFCCFNNSYKILPAVFDRWMRILRGTDNSVLWLQNADAAAADNLRREAARRGVDGARLIFASRMNALDEHLARLRVADLFLDTLPYNAHATAADALWAGVPLLTYPGETFASRVAASLVHTVGLPELVAASAADYEEKALALAANPGQLAQLRHKLAQRDTTLFDTAQYTRNLEALYQAIHARHVSGSPPDHINAHLAR